MDKLPLPRDFKDFLQLLNSVNTEYFGRKQYEDAMPVGLVRIDSQAACDFASLIYAVR